MIFLEETTYIDFSHPAVKAKAAELFAGVTDDTRKSRIAFEFVRDQIPHSFDIRAGTVTARASDVLLHKTGICQAKANLMAALLRSQGIPVGFCYQRLTRLNDASQGYVVHYFNAILLCGRWIKVDARGNKDGVNAQFSLDAPVLAYPCRPRYQEYIWPGIYAHPHAVTMDLLERVSSIEEVWENLPDGVSDTPDVVEQGEIWMALKPYEPAMQPDIEPFCHDCFTTLGWEYDPKGRHADVRNIPGVYQSTGQFWCLYDAETLVGTVAVRAIDPAGQIAELKRLYVRPERQREGWGGLLFEIALRYAKGAGFRIIRADTQRGNAVSRHLTRKHGFREIPRYNDNDFAELFFELEV